MGHQAGDDVIKTIIQRCQKILREVDVFCRYGGEEFVVLIPECEMEPAVRIAERLRKTICEKPILTRKGKCAASISLGVAELKTGINSLGALIGYADDALYTAKETGRNRVVASTR
jgi:diguanylate cyclase (GGDEF)-like protein